MAEPRQGLLVDWGGVLTTNVFESFEAFCVDEGLRPESVRDAFMRDPMARELLADFECGRLDNADFERRFGAVLELEHSEGLIERLFGRMRPDLVMQDAVIAFKAAGVRTGLLSNSWGADTYDRRRFDALFDVLVISGRARGPQAVAGDLRRRGRADGHAPGELVFVDDLRATSSPRGSSGWHRAPHGHPRDLAQLEELLGVAVPLGYAASACGRSAANGGPRRSSRWSSGSFERRWASWKTLRPCGLRANFMSDRASDMPAG
jgi:putative hydrolase of the HAD superfamily